MEYCLQVTDLTKQYNGFCLDHVSFEVKQGSIMGFIGENGAGKSTTIKAILNLIHPDHGEIQILGEDYKLQSREKKELIGVVFDECHFHDNINATETGLFLSKIYTNWDDALFKSFLNKFKLPLKKSIKEYSRGMKMKLSIAAALSHHPKLLLLDEATSGLDPVIRNEILDVFYDFIQDEEHSILMSSHITSDLEHIADYITFIHDGKIILSDSKDTILENYAVIKCTKSEFAQIDSADIVGYRSNAYSCEVLVDNRNQSVKKYNRMAVDKVTLEDIMLYYGKEGM